MSLKVWDAGEKLDAQDLNDNFQRASMIQAITQTGGGSTSSGNWTSLMTKDLTDLGLDWESYGFSAQLHCEVGTSTTGEYRLRIVDEDDNEIIENLGTVVGVSSGSRYLVLLGSISSPRKIKTAMIQGRRTAGSNWISTRHTGTPQNDALFVNQQTYLTIYGRPGY